MIYIHPNQHTAAGQIAWDQMYSSLLSSAKKRHFDYDGFVQAVYRLWKHGKIDIIRRFDVSERDYRLVLINVRFLLKSQVLPEQERIDVCAYLLSRIIFLPLE